MHVEFYTAAKYGDNIAMRGTHAVNIDLGNPTKSIICVLVSCYWKEESKWSIAGAREILFR